jgi:hypothetical protein
MTNKNNPRQKSPKGESNFNPMNVGESGGTNGNNSDNSGFSLGNNSFGFNFDSEEGNPSPVNSEAGGKSDEDHGGRNEEADTREGQEVRVRNSTANSGEACVTIAQSSTLPKSTGSGGGGGGGQDLKMGTSKFCATDV